MGRRTVNADVECGEEELVVVVIVVDMGSREATKSVKNESGC